MATITSTTPLSEAESKMIRQSLAVNLGLNPTQLDGVGDDIRLLQRNVVLQMSADFKKKQMELAKSKGGELEDGMEMAIEEGKSDAVYMREVVMDLQGLGKPKEEEGENLLRIRKKARKQILKSTKEWDDDYLVGPMTIDTYMVYRMRPLMLRLQTKVDKLSFRLSLIDVLTFIVQASGSVFAYFNFGEWVALTVGIAAILQAFIAFMELRNQVTTMNLALRDLQNLNLFWDSLSIVRRRTPAIKMQVVSTTETAYQMIVKSATTASANEILQVAKQFEHGEGEEEAKKAE